MMEKQKNKPRLRFPEFGGEWEKKKLGEIADVKTGPFGSSLHQHDYVEMGTPIITVEHLNELGIIHKNLPLVSDKDKLRLKSYLLITGDLVFSRVGSVDRCSMISSKENGWLFSGRLLRVRFNDQFSSFFNYNFQLEKTKQNVRTIAVGQTMPSINTEILKSIQLDFPSLPEQTKIASFLTVVDEKLQSLKKKKGLLEEYKKGVMQKLFSQEIRFQDDTSTSLSASNGNDFPDWEVKKLGEVAERITKKNKENNLNVLTISAQFGLISQLEFFNKSVSAKDVSGYYLLNKNDFAYNKSYSNGYPMGAIKRLNRYEQGVVSTLYICFRFNGLVNLHFMEQYFEMGLQNTEIEKVAQEGARNHGLLNIGVNDFLNIDLNLPSIPEQTKIANFLSALDEKINHTQAQIEKTELWKKGLLQRMFV